MEAMEGRRKATGSRSFIATFFVGFRRRENLDRSARLFDRLDCRLGRAVDRKLQRHLDFTAPEQANAEKLRLAASCSAAETMVQAP